MDEMIRKELEKKANIKVVEGDTFDFRCTCCGACCRYREDILLSAYDVMRIQKYLGIDFQTLLEKYCELYLGSTSKLPIIRIKPKGDKRTCPFLYKNKCVIHEVKPMVCALFPVGRVTKLDQENGKPEMMYFVQQIDCGAKDIRNNLQDWVSNCVTDYDEQCGMLWHEMLITVHEVMSSTDGKISNTLFSYLVQIMYVGYEKVEDFAEEVAERIKQLNKLKKTLKRDA